MGGITLLYFNDDRPYRKTGISYVFQIRLLLIKKVKRNFTKERRGDQRRPSRVRFMGMQGEKFMASKQDGM